MDQHQIPTREEMIDLLWRRARADETKDSDRAKLCRVIAHLQGYNRSEDYSDLEEQLRELRARRATTPEPKWYQHSEQEH